MIDLDSYDYPLGTSEVAEIAGLSIQRAQQFARTYNVMKMEGRYSWSKKDVEHFLNRKNKRGPKLYDPGEFLFL